MKIKILVVDDSAFMRKVISDMLAEDDQIEVIGTATNGKEALKKINFLRPDLITLDIEMPIMDGINTLKVIMAEYQIPVIMLSSLTTEGAEATLKALELGALDFIPKPTNIFKIDSTFKKNEFISKIKTATSASLSNNFKIQIKETMNHESGTELIKKKANDAINVISIGTSTGGPKALQSIIPFIPVNLNAAIVIVQHMPAGFTKSLANRLDSLSKITVKEAENGEEIRKGWCYIAPGDYHMTIEEKSIKKVVIKLDRNSPVSGHRPSVDVLMESVAKAKYMNKLGIILTGMGSDGASGIKKIKDSKGYTIAQDKSTSVVYGMPKSAIQQGAIDKILPIDKIADEIINKVGC